MRTILGWGRVCVFAILISACSATSYDIRVSAMRDPSMAGRSYWLLPAGDERLSDQLEYRAYEGLIHKALATLGYQRVDASTRPHLVIRLSYGIGPPEMRVTTHAGGWIQTNNRATNNAGGWGQTNNRAAYNTGLVSGRRGFFVGARVETWTESTSWIRLSAVDGDEFTRSGRHREIWTAVAYTTHKSRDLFSLFPYLLATTMDYLGKHAPVEKRILVPFDSERADWLRRG